MAEDTAKQDEDVTNINLCSQDAPVDRADEFVSARSAWNSPVPPWMWAVAGVVVLSITGLVVGLLLGGHRSGADDLFAEDSPKPSMIDGMNIPALVGGPGEPYVEGVERAAVTVSIYEDLACPSCQQLHDNTVSILDAAVDAGNATVERYVVSTLGDGSRVAANALACSAEQGAFNVYLSTVFRNQPSKGEKFTFEKLVEIARLSHVKDLSSFDKCLVEGKYADYVLSVNDTATRTGVAGTPFVLVNGEVIDLTTTTAAEFSTLVNGGTVD